MDEFSLADHFRHIYRRWRLVALCVFLGGAAGWVFHLFQPPVYEARAVITAQIDFTQTWELNELEQDQAVGAVMGLFASTPVLQQVIEQAQARGLGLDRLVYGENISVERRRARLELQVRDRDPEKAASLANLWAEIAYQALLDAHVHALRAQAIGQILYPYAGCPTPSPNPEGAEACPPPPWVGQDPLKLEAELRQELQAGQAILPAMIFDFSEQAAVPAEPVARRADLLALAGALAGLVCGWILASLEPDHAAQPGKPVVDAGRLRGG
jgi:uncharacterized protein involved in exopolysaccharide biosynthesis